MLTSEVSQHAPIVSALYLTADRLAGVSTGLEQQIQEIKEAVELPLTHPELYEEMGIKPPKGECDRRAYRSFRFLANPSNHSQVSFFMEFPELERLY